MRFMKVAAVVAVCVFGLSVLANAKENKFGVADSQKITFFEKVRIGDLVLPSGDYQVLHSMDGDHHIMVFKQLHSRRPVEGRVQCNLVPLQKKADRTEMKYGLNADKEWVLQALVFKGDSAQHVF
jgi:hypothetical protein